VLSPTFGRDPFAVRKGDKALDTYHVVLYIHFLALFVGVGAAAILVLCLFQLRGARTLADAVPWGRVAGRVGLAFPIAILGLFASGAYMTSDVWTWSTGWIDVAIAALVVLALQGPLVGERTAKKLERALHSNGPGPLGDEARRMIRHPGLWVTEFTAIGLVLATVWNMTQKPGTATAIVAVVIGYAVGIVLALAFTRTPAEELAPAPDPMS
jgi:hypothetical protein